MKIKVTPRNKEDKRKAKLAEKIINWYWNEREKTCLREMKEIIKGICFKKESKCEKKEL